MDAKLEQKARELLADELLAAGHSVAASYISSGRKSGLDDVELAAIRAIARALEQREGFVMMPREPTPEMVNAACAIKLRRLNELAAGKDGSGIEAGIREDYAAMLAAAPKPEGVVMGELKPCPWCGSKMESGTEVIEGSTFRWRRVVGCCTDGPEVRHDTMADDQQAAEADSRARAIAEWNTRPAAPTKE